MPSRTDQYIINNIQIVSPDNVSVLDATQTPTLTLVTCYPFYFVGSAPQRYIVTASKQVSGQPDESVKTSSSSTGKKIAKRRKQDDFDYVLEKGHARSFAVEPLYRLHLTAYGQVQTKTTTATAGAPTHAIKVERGTVVYFSGNSCVIKAEDGTLRHFDNVPDSVTVTVDGKQLNIHQIQPGMVLERQTITTTTPRMITTVKTVTGTVWVVNPPSMVILTLEDGTNQKFTIPKGQMFTVDGQQTDAFGIRKGMKIDAQKIVEQPETVVSQQIKRTGIAPPPPPAPKADVPMLVAVEAPAPAPVETQPRGLPTVSKTATICRWSDCLPALLRRFVVRNGCS